ncbi:MAG: Dna2/Cas4 domain-containing protein [Deltaproteobacteria bacterium]|nr:MAG: Dna2/Cas4 domain-containing protein [Deltaproteobacteria bacterium]
MQKIDKNQPNFGKFIYGVDGKTIKVKFDKLRQKTAKIIIAIRDILLEKQIPIFRLKDHCKICQFSNTCHDSAILNSDFRAIRF